MTTRKKKPQAKQKATTHVDKVSTATEAAARPSVFEPRLLEEPTPQECEKEIHLHTIRIGRLQDELKHLISSRSIWHDLFNRSMNKQRDEIDQVVYSANQRSIC